MTKNLKIMYPAVELQGLGDQRWGGVHDLQIFPGLKLAFFFTVLGVLTFFYTVAPGWPFPGGFPRRPQGCSSGSTAANNRKIKQHICFFYKLILRMKHNAFSSLSCVFNKQRQSNELKSQVLESSINIYNILYRFCVSRC